MSQRLQPAVFLDRDGTINVEKGYVYRIDDFEYIEGVIDGLRSLRGWGYQLVIITNQSGIARGYYSEEDFYRLTHWMLLDLDMRGVHIEAVYHCPHHPFEGNGKYTRNCNCRKPKTGLFYQAAEELAIDLSNSIAIGDKLRDLEICNETEVKGILLSETFIRQKGIVSCKDWREIICRIRKMRGD
jgi:D-glycero-D-manno-heptose 1,7-bisphosphate phosphatase